MPAALTSDDLLTQVKAVASVPAADGRLSDADLLALADRLILTKIGRAVYDADDGRWVATAADVAVTSGTATYRLPTRAWAADLDGLHLVDSNGNLIPIGYVDRDEAPRWQNGPWSDPRFTMEGDVIKLLPTPTNSSYSLRVRYLRRPSSLVTVASCAQVATVASGSLTVDSVPSSWTGTTLSVDYVESTHHGEALEDDVSVTESSLTLTRGSGTNATTGAYAVAADDYVCASGTTCVVQVPDVAIPMLVELLAAFAARTYGDSALAGACRQEAELERRELEQAIAGRSRIAPKAIPHHSPLRSGSIRRRRWSTR